MIVVQVWLLVTALGVAPHQFPSPEACAFVARNLHAGEGAQKPKCIQVPVVVPGTLPSEETPRPRSAV